MDDLSRVSTTDSDLQVEKKGRSGPRTISGCVTCRIKKVKCDETRPICKRCSRLTLLCDYRLRSRRNAKSATSFALLARVRNDRQQPVVDPVHSWIEGRALLLPTNLPELVNSACSLDLSSADHEAIRYFRTQFAKIHHTKNPDYSVFSIMFTIAERDSIAMCVILALAGREMEHRRHHASLQSITSWKPLQYYNAALGLLADRINCNDAGSQLDLDTLFTIIYLMLIFEQKYGQGGFTALSTHLSGIAGVLERHCQNIPLQIEESISKKALLRDSHGGQEDGMSMYSARMLIYICIFDSSAATFGFGGCVNQALRSLFEQHGLDPSPVEDFSNLHNFTNPLYQSIWAQSYPQAELLDDVENRAIYSLLADASQLRFLVAELGEMEYEEARKQTLVVRRAIQRVGRRYCELLEVAEELSASTDNSQRLVDNIRAIVPQYHAVVLEFIRIAHPGIPEVEALRPGIPYRISAIMSLTHQAFKHGSHQALTRVSWPLYVVFLMTKDRIYRDWILDRFQGMSDFGENLERAFVFMRRAMEMQAHPGSPDPRTLLESGDVERFVI